MTVDRTTAQYQIQSGSDVVFEVAGGFGLGALDALAASLSPWNGGRPGP